MQAALCRAPTLPAQASVRAGSRRSASIINCAAPKQQQQQQQQTQQRQPEASAALALGGLNLLLASPALADEAEAAAEMGGFGGFTPLAWALALSPIVFYGGFNVYRSFVDPRAKFGDAVFVFAALVLLGNIISITVFKVRWF